MMKFHFQATPLWQKIYFIVFTLITLVILLFSLKIIDISYKHGINREYSQALDKHALFTNAIKMYANSIDEIAYNPRLKEEMLKKAVQNYGRYYTDNKSYIAMISEEGEKLYSSIPQQDEQMMQLSPSIDGRRSYVIREIDSRKVLFVSSWITIGEYTLRLDYENDISNMLNEQRRLYTQIILLYFGETIILAIGLYILIKYSLQPLARLGEQAKAIAKRNYEQRITTKYGGEIGQLAMEFNQMADSVSSHMELLKQEIKERERFIASLAHEFKTPLTSIIGYTSLLQNVHLSQPEMDKALYFIHHESKRLDDISKKLLNLFRLRNGQILHKKEISISSILEQLEIASKFHLTKKDQLLKIVSFTGNVTIDQELFLILLSNLVENASKASNTNTSISLNVYIENAYIIFSVKDNGRGIPQEHLQNVFQPFFMLNSARNKTDGGYGLGLSLCKAITEAHDGIILIDSKLGKGTTVNVKIPLN